MCYGTSTSAFNYAPGRSSRLPRYDHADDRFSLSPSSTSGRSMAGRTDDWLLPDSLLTESDLREAFDLFPSLVQLENVEVTDKEERAVADGHHGTASLNPAILSTTVSPLPSSAVVFDDEDNMDWALQLMTPVMGEVNTGTAYSLDESLESTKDQAGRALSPTCKSASSTPSVSLCENDLTAEECVVMAIAKAQAASDRPLSKADMRRIRNTEAARQSRRRKMEQLQALEGKIHEMEAANKQLEEDKTVLLAQNHDYFERIQMLERQVAELSGAVLALSCSGTKRTSEIIEEHGRRVKRTKMITG